MFQILPDRSLDVGQRDSINSGNNGHAPALFECCGDTKVRGHVRYLVTIASRLAQSRNDRSSNVPVSPVSRSLTVISIHKLTHPALKVPE